MPTLGSSRPACSTSIREANAVLLERTVFYPGGGGQPADIGTLIGDSGGSWRVTGARKRDDDIWHTVEESAELPAVDTKVTAEIDWERRHRLMRTHSALHVLCGVVWRDQALRHRRQHGAATGRMDFEFETDVRRSRRRDRDAGQRGARRRSGRFASAILPREEAFAIPD